MAKIKRKNKVKIVNSILAFLGVFLIGLCFIYMILLRPVDRHSTANIEVKIKSGMRTKEIARTLKSRGLIRSELVFQIEYKMNHGITLKADTYQLQKNMSLREILHTISKNSNYNPDVVRITFKEGETLKKYALDISKHTKNSYDSVISTVNNYEYLTQLVSRYWFLTEDILNTNLYFGLEGYLAPNTYEFKDKNVSVQDIIEVMLNQTEKELSPYKDQILSSNISVHEYLTLASIAELEGKTDEDRKMIIGVFRNRQQKKMNLGSDVTTYYALQVEMKEDLTVGQFATINPYNTRAENMGGKLPVGPICNPSISSIIASIYPKNNDYYYFVADKNGKIYYTKTISEHQNKVSEIKEKGMWIW